MIVVCVPAHNEEKTIAKVLVQAARFADHIIVCDDGSTDETRNISSAFGSRVIVHAKNLGYGAALLDLFTEALRLNPDAVVTLDGDGQHEPSQIPTVTKPILEGKAHIVTGSRFLGGSRVKRYRRLGIKLIGKATDRATGDAYSDSQCGFRAYSPDALRKLLRHGLVESGMGLSAEILLKARELGLKVAEVPVTINYDGLDTSEHNPVSQGMNVLGTILRTVVERKPLTYFGVPSTFFVFLGCCFLAWALEIYTSQRVLVTNIALVAFFSLMVGVFFMFMAVSLYLLGRIRQEITARWET